MPKRENTEALYEVDNEIKTVYEYCLAAGLTHEEIVERAGPLLRPLKKEEWRKRIMMLLKIGICCLALSYTLSSDKVFRMVMSNARHMMFKILPLWDWTDLYTESCLLDNPLYADEQVILTDCEVCEEVFNIDYINKTTPEEISQDYIQRNLPVIVNDAMSDWPSMKDSFNILNLTEGYLFMKEDVCMFHTNLRVENHNRLFRKLLNEEVQKWYAHWENCQKASQKFLRKFYTRPYFLPGIIQITESNWIFMSSGYVGKKFKMVDVLPSLTFMWVAQLRGYNNIRFEPKEPCDRYCNILEDILEEGEIVLFNPAIWSFSYLPGEGTENLALGAGGFSHFS
ncbi:uncharacterized protein LOC129230753 [Uloborus diversus]|uniref:uncharacterized protein LOC129230753 n=1 Tax=Uloborus diversus TaxID=327109 RepID=UPI002409C713|nr:uncharacterized protein LOC129230753 [Uloborus diversus]